MGGSSTARWSVNAATSRPAWRQRDFLFTTLSVQGPCYVCGRQKAQVAYVSSVMNAGVGILSSGKWAVPLVVGAAGTSLDALAMVAPRALGPVDPGPVTVMIIVSVELTHGRHLSPAAPRAAGRQR